MENGATMQKFKDCDIVWKDTQRMTWYSEVMQKFKFEW